MDADDSGRYPRGLVTLRTLLTGLSELDGRGKDLSLTARADLPLGPLLASHRHGSVVQWRYSYDSSCLWPFMGMCWGVVAMLWGIPGVHTPLVITHFPRI